MKAQQFLLASGSVLGLMLLTAQSVLASAPPVKAADLEPERIYSPYAGRNYPDQVLFGDTHFHTDLSFDAGLIGTQLGVDEAYRFARGEQVLSNTRQPVQLVRPLDFLVITDHAEFMGLASMIRESSPFLMSSKWGR